MSDFWRIAYSTEIIPEMTVCYDTTDYDCSYIHEPEASYAEFREEAAFNFEGYNY